MTPDAMLIKFIPSYRYVAANGFGRDFAVGDVHGSFDALERALDHIGFDRVVDRLFIMGDLVDRGMQSHEVTTWLDHAWVFALFGNHELFTVWGATGNLHPDIDHIKYGGAWLYDLPAEEQFRIAARLITLPLIIEVATAAGPVGLVHADCPFDDWAAMRSTHWSELDERDPLVNTCLWSIERYKRRYGGVVRNIRAVVHGHMTVPSVETLGNVYYIDTGGWRSDHGRFSFLNLETLETVAGPGQPLVRVKKRYR
jgi:serine/threonine protein phosphatase 1